MSTTKKVTIQDVAKACGVAVSSVSKALNNPPETCPLKDETRDRVITTARKLGYQPNWHSKAQTRAIGILQSHDSWLFSGIYNDMFHELFIEIKKQNYFVSYQPLVPTEDEADLLSTDKQVDGNLVVGWVPEWLVNELIGRPTPFVLLNHKSERAPSIVFDDYNGARMATEHLLELGHERIGFYQSYGKIEVKPGYPPHYSQPERKRGFLESMERAGLRQQAICFSGETDEVVRKYVQEEHPLTAVICYSHTLALKLLRELRLAGLNPPEDLSIITFNDVYPTGDVYPSITALNLPVSILVESGLTMLFDLIKDPSIFPTAPVISFPEELVIRESTVPHRKS